MKGDIVGRIPLIALGTCLTLGAFCTQALPAESDVDKAADERVVFDETYSVNMHSPTLKDFGARSLRVHVSVDEDAGVLRFQALTGGFEEEKEASRGSEYTEILTANSSLFLVHPSEVKIGTPIHQEYIVSLPSWNAKRYTGTWQPIDDKDLKAAETVQLTYAVAKEITDEFWPKAGFVWDKLEKFNVWINKQYHKERDQMLAELSKEFSITQIPLFTKVARGKKTDRIVDIPFTVTGRAGRAGKRLSMLLLATVAIHYSHPSGDIQGVAKDISVQFELEKRTQKIDVSKLHIVSIKRLFPTTSAGTFILAFDGARERLLVANVERYKVLDVAIAAASTGWKLKQVPVRVSSMHEPVFFTPYDGNKVIQYDWEGRVYEIDLRTGVSAQLDTFADNEEFIMLSPFPLGEKKRTELAKRVQPGITRLVPTYREVKDENGGNQCFCELHPDGTKVLCHTHHLSLARARAGTLGPEALFVLDVLDGTVTKIADDFYTGSSGFWPRWSGFQDLITFFKREGELQEGGMEVIELHVADLSGVSKCLHKTESRACFDNFFIASPRVGYGSLFSEKDDRCDVVRVELGM